MSDLAEGISGFERQHSSSIGFGGATKRPLPISVPLTQEEFKKLLQLQITSRWDWPVTFSANEYGHIWPYVSPGYTTENRRFHVRGAVELLDYLSDLYLSIRPMGGRFFINEEGAYFGDASWKEKKQFVKFRFATTSETPRRAPVKPLGPGRTQDQLDRHNDQVCVEERCPFCTDDRLRKRGINLGSK